MLNIILTDFGIFLIVNYIGKELSSYRYSEKKIRYILFFLFYLLTCFINFTGNITHQSTLLMTFVYFCYYYIQFNLRGILLILTTSFVLLIGYLSEFLAALILITWDSSMMGSETHLLAFIISLIINFVFSYTFVKVAKLYETIPPRYFFGIIVLPLFTLLLIFRIGSYYDLVFNHKDILFILFGLIVGNFLFLYFFFLSIQSIQLKNQLIEEKIEREKVSLKYDLLNDHYKANFNFLHDLLHRGNHLYQLSQKQEYNRLHKEISDLNQIAFKEFNAIYSNNIALNSLINEKMNLIRSNHLEIRTEIFHDLSFLSFDKQMEMFDCILDIVFSCFNHQVISEKYLIIRTYQKGSSIILKIAFPSNLNIDIDDAALKECLKQNSVSFDYKFDEEQKNLQYLIIFS